MPPTLVQLRASVARDVRDEGMKTFKQPYLDDLINAGIEEVGRLYPKETVLTLTPVVNQTDYAMPTIQTAFRVEVVSAAGTQEMDADTGESGSGWDVFAGSLRLTSSAAKALNGAQQLRVWGYANRTQLVADSDVSDLDSTAEWGVRRYARSQAFTAMNNDRALFKQWQGQSQNTDVSPNMLNQMVSLYSSEWDRQRNYLRRLRRI